jgi:hypothetical protein
MIAARRTSMRQVGKRVWSAEAHGDIADVQIFQPEYYFLWKFEDVEFRVPRLS